MPPQNTFGELLARLNRDVARLNTHYDNSRWLADMGERLEEITVDIMTLTLDVAGRRFRIDAGKLLNIKHLGQIAGFLQEEETATGISKIVTVAESVREIYDLAFPRGADGAMGSEGPDEDEVLQQMPKAKAGK